jgi:heme exporter protein C
VCMNDSRASMRFLWPYLLTAVGIAAALAMIFAVVPTEETMGEVQRILYIHIAVAWFAVAAFLGTAATGAGFLLTRRIAWDHWSRATAEMAWLCLTLTLATGSLWARGAWNTWWTWDPRLTTVFILWAICSGYWLLRSGIEDVHRSARAGAVLAILGAIDLPLVVMATRWFRGMHPRAPAMAVSMRVAMLLSAAAFGLLFTLLTVLRRMQIRQESDAIRLEQDLDARDDVCTRSAA